jgi:hypothetical protein
LGQAGAGTSPLLLVNGTYTNTRTSTGSNLTAYVPWYMNLTANTTNLTVVKNDVLKCNAEVSGTLANNVTTPTYQIRVISSE